jgi:PAP2 superfamily
VLGVYLLYSVLRSAVRSRQALAEAHARTLLAAEEHLHLAVEAGLVGAAQRHPLLLQLAEVWYSALHLPVTAAVGGWLFVRRRDAAGAWRAAWVAVTLSALVGFAAWPTAPPRLLPDALRQLPAALPAAAEGSWVSGVTNPYAAMPSLHVAWAVWCAAAVATTSGRAWRHLVWCYPAGTVLVVLVTANHYLADVAAGLALAAAGAGLARWIVRSAQRREQQVDQRVGDLVLWPVPDAREQDRVDCAVRDG